MPPELSIGMPSLNAGTFLREAVQSIFAQSFTDWELIVVDDGSDDGSFSSIANIGDARVRVSSDGRHQGLAARLNQITALARGKYIARMDADDLSHPRRFEMQIEFLRQHSDIDGVGCALLSFDHTYRVRGHRTFPGEMRSIAADPLHGIRIAHATFCGRKQWFERHPYNEKHVAPEDWELWQSSYRESQFANLRQPLYFYREFDSFRFRKYLHAQVAVSRMQWAMRKQFGIADAACACGRNLLAIAAYSGAAACPKGVVELLIARRSQAADIKEQKEFDEAVMFIQSLELSSLNKHLNAQSGNQ